MLGACALFYPSSAAHYFVMPTLPSVMRLYLLVVTTSVVGTVAPSLKMGGGDVLANLMLHMLLATAKLVYSWLLPVKTTVFNKKSSGALFNAKILMTMW